MTGLEDDLGYLLARASFAIGAQLLAALADHGLSLRGYTVLVALHDGGPAASVALAAHVGIDKSTMTVTVDELERAGHLRRVPDPADRRVRRLEPTPEGLAAARSAQAAVRAVERRVLADVPAADRTALLRTLRALVAGPLSQPVDAALLRRAATPRSRRG